MDIEQRGLILSILGRAKTLTVATVRGDGWPQATVVSFVNEELNLYFGTDPQSQKIKNIARNPRVSATVTPDYETANDVQAISLAAEAERVTDPAELARVAALVLEKFPRSGSISPMNALEGLAVVRLRPAIVSVLDYATRFGQSDLIDLRDEDPSDGRDSQRP